MQLDELFRNLGQIAGTIGAQMRGGFDGVPLEELDLTGAPPQKVALCGPAQLVLSEGEVFRVDVEPGPSGAEALFSLGEEKLGIGGGDAETVVRVTLPAPRKLTIAGSGRVTAAKLARDGKVSVAGSGSRSPRSTAAASRSASPAAAGSRSTARPTSSTFRSPAAAAATAKGSWSTRPRCTSPARATRSSPATAKWPRT